MNYFEKLEIINKIKTINKFRQVNLFKYIYNNLNINKYSTNRNGTFIDFNDLSIDNYIDIKRIIESNDEDLHIDKRENQLHKLKSTLKEDIPCALMEIKKKSETHKQLNHGHSQRQLKVWNKYKDPTDSSTDIDVDKMMLNYIKFKNEKYKKNTLYKRITSHKKTSVNISFEEQYIVSDSGYSQGSDNDSILEDPLEEVKTEDQTEAEGQTETEDQTEEEHCEYAESEHSVQLDHTEEMETFKKLLVNNGIELNNTHLDYERYIPIV